MAEDYSNKNIVDVLRSSWFLIVFIGLIVIGWTRMQSDIHDHESRINELERRQEQTDNTLNQLAIDLQEIKTTLLFIKEKLQ